MTVAPSYAVWKASPSGSRPPWILLVAMAVAACGRSGPDAHRATGAALVLDASEVHVVGSSESLAVVEDLQALSDGSIWVLNSSEPFFVRFSGDGEVLQEYGARGGGPEEFLLPAGFVTRTVYGDAWVLDARRHAFIELSRPDSAWNVIRIPSDSLPPGSLIGGRSLLNNQVRTARLGEEIILPRTGRSLQDGMIAFSAAIWGADLWALEPASGSARRVLALSEVLGDPMAAFGATTEPPPMLLWFRLWAICGGDEIRVYDRLRNEVRGFSPDGAELDAVPLPPIRLTEVAPEQFARAIFAFRQAEMTGEVGSDLSSADSARLISQIVQQSPWDPNQLATVLPRYVDLRCTDEGVLWMQPFDPTIGGLVGGRTWIRVTEAGATEVVFPERFDPFQFATDRIWGIQRDELDVASVAWVPAPQPE